MSKGVIKKALGALVALGILALLVLLSIQSINEDLRISKSDMGMSNDLSYKEKRAASTSRMSAVRIVSMTSDGSGMSSMSGTYVTVMGRYYVLTVMHGIAGPCELTKIIVEDVYYDCIKYITVDSLHDYAIMEVEKIFSRHPISIILDTPLIQS